VGNDLTPDLERWIEELSETLTKPLLDVGTLLSTEIEKLRAEVNELQQHVAGLQERVRALEGK
jgi:FtsZ-binding cell division protein ZapB